MASPGLTQVIAALETMQSNVDATRKSEAHEFLGTYQKSPEAWTTSHELLASPNFSTEKKLFAATTLKGKIVYDLDQLPRSSLLPLRDSILALLSTYRDGPRPIRTQLCVCLANLAIQMIEWKDVLQVVGSSLGASAGDCILEFLQVLPEEVTEGRKINLTEEELITRSKELLEDNSTQVMTLLIQYSSSSPSAAINPRLLECISSWLREIPSASIVNSPLLDVVVNALSHESSFEAAVECMCVLYRDTKEVDESVEVIQILYAKIVPLRSKIVPAAAAGDLDIYKGLTRIFAEAGEAWAVMIARLPAEFRGLVEAILECCALDQDREAISITFQFWFELKQYLTLESYKKARKAYADIYAKLVDIMIKHLEFPTPEGPDKSDLFDGDREQEEKFREFRHQMGDVLKDCCEVISVTECLGKAYNLINDWCDEYAAEATSTNVPHWQQLEAPLFAMRGMGKMVSKEESVVLHQLIPLIVQIPSHEKLQFQAIMALGRYTEWTAEHPQFLQMQLNFIIDGFASPSTEVVRAAALAFRFFGTDCSVLLKDHLVQLQSFYESVLDKLPQLSQEEVTHGVSCVIAQQPPQNIYSALKLYCDPVIERLKTRANLAHGEGKDEEKVAVADCVLLITIFIDHVQPYYGPNEENQAVRYCQDILPVLAAVVENFLTFHLILERVCRCWRAMVLSYRTAILPLLPALADQLAIGFEKSHSGGFLWTTDAVLREFSDAELVDSATSQAIYRFFEQQAVAFLRIMNNVQPVDFADVIEDFFRLLDDTLIYYNREFVPSPLCSPILQAAIAVLVLQQHAPLSATLHYLYDFISYGSERPSSSSLDDAPKPIEIQPIVKRHVLAQGENLVRGLLTGMMYSFPRDCLQDATAILIAMFEILPDQTGLWVKNTIAMMPPGTLKQGEAERVMANMATRVQQGDFRKLRSILQDFTTSYRRRNVAPRDGLGSLEPKRFRYTG